MGVTRNSLSEREMRAGSALKKVARNPFEYGRELNADELCDRANELTRIQRVAENRGKLFVIGPRRYGKTSLLHAAEQRLAAQGIVALRFDAERYETLGLLAEAILRGATRLLTGPAKRARDLFAASAKRFRPELTFDATEQTWSLSLGIALERGAATLPLLIEALDAVDRLAASTQRATVVILDEFQQIVIEGTPAAERQLRATVQRHRHVGYVFAGSATRLMSDMVTKRGRAFYRLGESLFVGALPSEEFRRYLRERFEASGFAVTDAGLDVLLGLVDVVPLSVQRLAHECWERCRSGESSRVDDATVAAALETVLGQENPAFTRAWISLTRAQKIALKAVVLERGHAMFSHDAAARAGIPVATMQRALRSLEQAQWVRKDDAQSPARYYLEDPFFGAWIRWAQGLPPPRGDQG
jgi:DNA-binding IclR family transcriptional regulator